MRARTFYEDEGWFAFLAAPPNLRGHTILAAKSMGQCPQALTEGILSGIHLALAAVTRVLRARYTPNHVVFASLRVQDPHFHLHLFPVTKEQEEEWRQRKGAGYASGRFFEFLGDCDRDARNADRLERDSTGWTEEQQRLEHTGLLGADVAALKAARTADER
jgi:diadenosine tetraphosphate (Ap4A) HIT family hydrolase